MPLNIDIQQILLHMFNLVLLFAISYFLLYTPIKKFMDGRKKYYEDMDAEAKAKLDEAEASRAEYEEKLAKCEEEAKSIKAAAVSEANVKREAIINDASKEAESIVENAKKQAEFERERSVTNAKQEIEEYVSKAAGKIIGGNDPYGSFLDAAKKDSDNE